MFRRLANIIFYKNFMGWAFWEGGMRRGEEIVEFGRDMCFVLAS